MAAAAAAAFCAVAARLHMMVTVCGSGVWAYAGRCARAAVFSEVSVSTGHLGNSPWCPFPRAASASSGGVPARDAVKGRREGCAHVGHPEWWLGCGCRPRARSIPQAAVGTSAGSGCKKGAERPSCPCVGHGREGEARGTRAYGESRRRERVAGAAVRQGCVARGACLHEKLERQTWASLGPLVVAVNGANARGARSPLLQKEKFVCDAMPEQQPERQQPERGAADVEAALPLFQGVRYSLLFGECNGWLGCSHCRKWRRAVEAFSAEQRAKPLDERCCMACSRLEEGRIEDGDLRPSIAECARHSGNLDQRRVNLFLGKGLPRAEAHLAQLAAKECMSPESVALQRAKRDIVKFDRNTDGWWLARIDYEWVARVDEAADAAALATELLYMLDAQSAKGKRELAEMSGRPMQALVDTLKDVEGGRATAVLSEHRALLPPVIVVPDGSIASVGVRLVEYVARELLQKAGLLNAHRKAQKKAAAGTRLVADFKAVTDVNIRGKELVAVLWRSLPVGRVVDEWQKSWEIRLTKSEWVRRIPSQSDRQTRPPPRSPYRFPRLRLSLTQAMVRVPQWLCHSDARVSSTVVCGACATIDVICCRCTR